MKRTTISLPDDVAAALEREARRLRVPVSRVAREAIEARLRGGRPGGSGLPFAALARSGHRNTARDLEDLLQEDWSHAGDR